MQSVVAASGAIRLGFADMAPCVNLQGAGCGRSVLQSQVG